tara:strand:- start:6712 stop:7302 length:591 start_codon:yes stop_codon:yes gene_type:complete
MNQPTKNEILSILKKNNVKCNSSLKKDELIKLMKKHKINNKNHKEVKKGAGVLNKISNSAKGAYAVGQRRYRYAGRFRDLEAIATFIPNSEEERAGGEEFKFTRNLWRNLKRNILILSCIPTEKFEELLETNNTTSTSQTDAVKNFKQLVAMIKKSSSGNGEGRVKIDMNENQKFDKVKLSPHNGGKKNKKKKEKK